MELVPRTGNSEAVFAAELQTLSDAGAAVIHVRTNEFVRAVSALRRVILSGMNLYYEWNVLTGMTEFDIASLYSSGKDSDGVTQFNEAIKRPLNRMSELEQVTDKLAYFVYCNPHHWVAENNPVALHLLKDYASSLPTTNIRIILLTPEVPLPETLAEGIMMLRLNPPSQDELLEYLDEVLSGVTVEDGEESFELDSEEKIKICQAAAGMSKVDFEMHISVSIINREIDSEIPVVESILDGIAKGKTEIINKTDILELRHPESMANVGGMENLKSWIGKRRRAYSAEAKDFGVDPPKGIVFVGLPGTGKSLAATAIAGELGIPLVRLDFGRVFNSLVGSSEQRVRDALRMVENMAPVVLFVDEIDKGLGGIGGSGDSGTSSRVLGTFLSWLQDNKAPVFTVVTANNIAGLPPELLRRGRFDDIFATGFPSSQERREVLNIHLRKRGWDLSDYDEVDIVEVVNASRGYVPSEIEQAVKDALVEAFVEDEDLEMSHIVNELKAMIPMHVTHNEIIQVMAAWMKDNAKPASKSYETGVLSEDKPSNVASINRSRKLTPKGRVSTTRRRTKKEEDDS